jgi:hypothetical protein
VENCRAICYDEVTYPEPHTYNPARFLDENGRIDPFVKDPEARVFGSGRRYEALGDVLADRLDRFATGFVLDAT